MHVAKLVRLQAQFLVAMGLVGCHSGASPDPSSSATTTTIPSSTATTQATASVAATDTAPMVSNALRANPDVAAIYAPYDELSKATLSALEQNPNLKGKVKVYGADISTADIELMTAADSPWVATGATDPNAIGAAVLRTLALNMAGTVTKGATVDFPPILITQDFLRSKNIRNMVDLRAAEPSLNISDISSADWIPTVTV